MPGVPPDAVDNVKRLLKGMFRRGKRSKQDSPAEPTTNTSTSHPSAKPDAPAVQQADSKPPPAVHDASAAAITTTTAPDTNKKLPSQPGSTTPAPASPTDTKVVTAPAAAQSPSPLPPAPQANSQGVSPATGTPANSAPVSAAGTPPALPPKTESAAAVPPPHVEETASEEPQTSIPQQSTTAAASEKEADLPPAPAKPIENAAPASAAPSGTIEPVPTPAIEALPAKAKDEQLPVLAQPPVVQPAQGVPDGTPGMSATSGPLEDFPEGTTK